MAATLFLFLFLSNNLEGACVSGRWVDADVCGMDMDGSNEGIVRPLGGEGVDDYCGRSTCRFVTFSLDVLVRLLRVVSGISCRILRPRKSGVIVPGV